MFYIITDSTETVMAELNDQEWMAYLNVLATGAMKGMYEAQKSLDESDPGKFPMLTESTMFDAASVLSAAILEAHPDYVDQKRFGKAADLARTNVIEYLRIVRGMSELADRPMLYSMVQTFMTPIVPSNTN